MQDNNDNKLLNMVKDTAVKAAKKAAKAILKIVLKILTTILVKFLPIILTVSILSACFFYIKNLTNIKFNDEKETNAPSVAAKTRSEITIDDETGKLKYEKGLSEIYDGLVQAGAPIAGYFQDDKVFKKMLNAEVATAFPDTREDVTKPINWDEIDLESSDNPIGVVKFKRTDSNGQLKYITYASPRTYYGWIEDYNVNGNQESYDNAMSHFTLERNRSGYSMKAQTITDGESIEIPDGVGTCFTYESWDYPKGNYGLTWAAGTNQLRFWQEADGLNSYDEEGFGIVNGRYVIACSETYGEVGDYVDFYQSDGNILHCIIGDMKSSSDGNYTQWGHMEEDGSINVIEFMVKTDLWYANGRGNHPNVGTETFHPELGGKSIVKAVNGGSYFDNPDFGKDEIKEKSKSKGSDGGSSNGMDSKTPASDKIVEAAKSTPPCGNFHCEQWVGDVYDNAGYPCTRNWSATEDWEKNWVSNDMDNIPIGATVYSAGLYPELGHVGIYIGDGEVMDQAETLRTVSLEQFATENGEGTWRGWGWNSPEAAKVAGDLIETGSGDKADSQYKMKSYVATVANFRRKVKTATYGDGTTVVESSQTTLGKQKIDFQSMTKPYSLPFNLLWEFLTIVEDKDFIDEWTDLVYNGNFEINIYDNYTKNTTVTEEIRSTTVPKQYIDLINKATGNNGESENEVTTIRIVHTEINESIQPMGMLARANCWYCDYINSCNVKNNETTTTDTQGTTYTDPVTGRIISNGQQTSTHTNVSRKYTKKTATIKEKVGLKEEQKRMENSKYGIREEINSRVDESRNIINERNKALAEKIKEKNKNKNNNTSKEGSKASTGGIGKISEALDDIINNGLERKKELDSGIRQDYLNLLEDVNTSKTFEGIDGILFIGDSITKGLGASGNITEPGVIFRGVGSATPAHWLNDGVGLDERTTSTLPADDDSISALCVMLGTNGLAVDYYTVDEQFNDMVNVLEMLHERYPEKTIFVQKIFYIYSEVAKVDEYNDKLNEYCNNSDFAVFIDATNGVALADGVHPTAEGYRLLADNIRSEITGKTGKGGYEKSFVALLQRFRYINVLNTIESAPEMLFEFIDSNADTTEYLDLIKYLLYKASGKDFGVTEFDVSKFNPYETKSSAGSGILGGEILEVCQKVTDHYNEIGAYYSVGGDLISGNIDACWDHQAICCATYTSMVLYKAGLLTEDQINKFNYHWTGSGGVPDMLQEAGWQTVSWDEAKPGDVLNKDTVHVMIYAGDGLVWDQQTCTYSRISGPYTSGDDIYSYTVWRAPDK